MDDFRILQCYFHLYIEIYSFTRIFMRKKRRNAGIRAIEWMELERSEWEVRVEIKDGKEEKQSNNMHAFECLSPQDLFKLDFWTHIHTLSHREPTCEGATMVKYTMLTFTHTTTPPTHIYTFNIMHISVRVQFYHHQHTALDLLILNHFDLTECFK